MDFNPGGGEQNPLYPSAPHICFRQQVEKLIGRICVDNSLVRTSPGMENLADISEPQRIP